MSKPKSKPKSRPMTARQIANLVTNYDIRALSSDIDPEVRQRGLELAADRYFRPFTYSRPRKSKPKPVTAAEVKRAALAMVSREFEGRPLNVKTAQRGLTNAALELTLSHPKKGRRT